MTNSIVVAGSTLPFARGDAAANTDPRDWERDLEVLRAHGFDAVDLVDSWIRVDLLESRQLRSLQHVLDASGVTLTGVSVIRASIIDPASGADNLARTLRAVDAASKLGLGIVGVGFHRPLTGAQLQPRFWMAPHPRDDDGDGDFRRAADRLGKICRHAVEVGIEISLELHEATLLDRSSRVLRIIDAVAAPNLGVNLDIGNLVRAPGPLPEPVTETVERLAPRVNYWHLKNYVRLEDPESGFIASSACSLEDGTIDYRRAVHTVLAAGYAGPLCVEHYGDGALEAMHRGRVYLEGLLEEGATFP